MHFCKVKGFLRFLLSFGGRFSALKPKPKGIGTPHPLSYSGVPRYFSLHMGRAMTFIADEHRAGTVLSLTFQLVVTGDHALQLFSILSTWAPIEGNGAHWHPADASAWAPIR